MVWRQACKYFKGDVHHRTDGPAIIWPDGTEKWYQNGVVHNPGGPAITDHKGYEEWFLNGVRHRDGGPAITDENGHEEWYSHGLRHREDGPAFTLKWSGYQSDKIDDIIFKRDGFERRWYRHGLLDRDPAEGPAVTQPDGKNFFYVKGKLVDPPALDFKSIAPELRGPT